MKRFFHLLLITFFALTSIISLIYGITMWVLWMLSISSASEIKTIFFILFFTGISIWTSSWYISYILYHYKTSGKNKTILWVIWRMFLLLWMIQLIFWLLIGFWIIEVTLREHNPLLVIWKHYIKVGIFSWIPIVIGIYLLSLIHKHFYITDWIYQKLK